MSHWKILVQWAWLLLGLVKGMASEMGLVMVLVLEKVRAMALVLEPVRALPRNCLKSGCLPAQSLMGPEIIVSSFFSPLLRIYCQGTRSTPIGASNFLKNFVCV